MSFMALNTIYNHYMTSYAPKSNSPQDTHKRSELRSVYNSIIKLNKESPVYLPITEKDTKEFAIEIKEYARALRNTISSLGNTEDGSLLEKKIAYTDNASVAEAEYIGSGSEFNDVPSLELSVQSLATPQVNMGAFLPSGNVELPSDTYSFDVRIHGMSYEFQFGISDEESNYEVQERLAKLINKSGIGLNVEVIGNDSGHSSLKISSIATGLDEGRQKVFSITDDETSKAAGLVEYFGLNYTSGLPSNAEFTINDQPHTSPSNNFTLAQTYQIQLNNVSAEAEVTHIGLKQDLDSMVDNIKELTAGYNNFFSAASDKISGSSKNTSLLREMKGISSIYRNELEAMGVMIDEDGMLNIQEDVLKDALENDTQVHPFDTLKNFAAALHRKTGQIALNPMQYVDKTIVAYKNPGRNFANPYITSAYSGMLFNGYC